MNVKAAFAFAREAVSTFQARAINEERGGKRGTLLFTGATASLRGNTITAALSAAKLALPAGLCGASIFLFFDCLGSRLYRNLSPIS
ncbi:hypothetical protein DFH94DRAFT_699694 [Russula ochroleuca]|uniref:Uncharacterized protein n=1 Tax=Russula ochroleuca TaxID=152965 RepID=A0A9P5JV14_9AGAM|nr:hypothetical protein DFH94DRAFT_699694 [Russula ochroleuca]